MLSFFPLDVLDETWDVIESVSEIFLTYSCDFISVSTVLHSYKGDGRVIMKDYMQWDTAYS